MAIKDTTSTTRPAQKTDYFSCDDFEDAFKNCFKIFLVAMGILFIVIGSIIVKNGFPPGWKTMANLSARTSGTVAIVLGAVLAVAIPILHIVEKKFTK